MHVTFPEVVNDLVPVAFRLQNDHIVVAVGSGEDFSVGARPLPQAEGGGIYNANGRFYGVRSMGGQSQRTSQGGH